MSSLFCIVTSWILFFFIDFKTALTNLYKQRYIKNRVLPVVKKKSNVLSSNLRDRLKSEEKGVEDMHL
jgi:hypothetical protein